MRRARPELCDPPCREAMGRWQSAGLTEGRWRNVAGPSTTRFASRSSHREDQFTASADFGGQIRQGLGPHQFHPALHLGAQQRDRAAHAVLARRGERVEIEAAARTGLRADRQRLQHMRAAGDAAVADHLDLVADRIDDLGQRVEGRAAAVELAPAMVRHHDRGGADLDRAPRILDRDDAFQAEGAVPLLADRLGAVPVEALVEHRGEIVGDRFGDARSFGRHASRGWAG